MNPNKKFKLKYCQTKKAIYWFYRDFSKRSWNKNWYWDRRDGTHTLEGGHVQISKGWSQGTNEVLVIGLHMVGKLLEYIYERYILNVPRLHA